MDSTPAKTARMFTTPRKVELTSSAATSDDQAVSEKETETGNVPHDDKEPQILALSSEDDSKDDIFSNSVDTSNLPKVSIVDESTTDSDNDKTPKKTSPKQKKASSKSVSTSSTRSSRNLSSASLASPLAKSR